MENLELLPAKARVERLLMEELKHQVLTECRQAGLQARKEIADLDTDLLQALTKLEAEVEVEVEAELSQLPHQPTNLLADQAQVQEVVQEAELTNPQHTPANMVQVEPVEVDFHLQEDMEQAV